MYEDLIRKIEEFPHELEKISSSLNDENLNVLIREGAWSIRQSINHLADSHINSFVRIKFALSEDNPTIMPYNEEKWAEISDTKNMDIEPSILIIKGLHARLVNILENIHYSDWERPLIHPDVGEMKLSEYVKVTAEHGSKHLQSIVKVLRLE